MRQSAKETGAKIDVKRDSELSPADYDSDLQGKHFDGIRDRLAENLAVDSKVAKQRIKDKRIKLKKRVRRELGMEEKDGVDEGEDEDMSADMGSGSDGSNNSNDSNQVSDNDDGDDDDEDESIEEIPLLKRKR